MIDKIRTILLDLPLPCRGYLYRDGETGIETCILNSRYSHEMNVQTYAHEMYHVRNNDFECAEDINAIEYRCHHEAGRRRA